MVVLPIAMMSLVSPALAREPDLPPVQLTSVGPWIADFDDDACHLITEFGSGEQHLVARFTRYQPGDSFDLMLYGDMLKRGEAMSKLSVSFGLAAKPIEVTTLNGSSAKTPMMMFGSLRFDGLSAYGQDDRPPVAVTTEQERSVNGLTIWFSRSRSVHLQLGSMARPMATMRTCLDSLQRHWGYDPAIMATLSRPVSPSSNPGNWLASIDYPEKALSKGQIGVVQFRLDVDEAGKPSACRILARTDPEDFATVSCHALMRRARFKPALDASGKAVKAYYISKIRFMIPY
jgi:hypothetical protein